MIPVHSFIQEKIKEIRVIQLGSLSQYNIAEPHRHDYIELFIFNRGGGIHEIDFVPFPVESQSIHFVSSGRVHQMKRELYSDGYVVLFHPSVFDGDHIISQFLFNLDCHDVTERTPVFNFNDSNQIIQIAENLWNYSQTKHELRHHFILNQINLLCLHCLNNHQEIEVEPTRDQQYYIQFRQALRHQFKEIKKVQDYAEIVGITSRKLNEIVFARTGNSVSKTIQKQLILEAKRLLNAGRSSKEIAFELNFEDPAHFSKFFKTQTGISPSEFQKIHH